MWGLRRALMQSDVHPDLQLILCGTVELPGSLVYENFRTGTQSLNAAILSALYRAGGDAEKDILVSSVSGNHYNVLGLLTDGCPFDFHIPGWPNPPATGVPLIPHRAVTAMMVEELREFDPFCRRLKGLAYRGFFHLASPAPVPDPDFIRSKLPPLPSGQVAEVSDPELRLKLWTLQHDIIERILTKHGGALIPAPEDSRDSNGFLKREFWKDSVHANARFHELQLEQVQKVLDSMQPVEVQ